MYFILRISAIACVVHKVEKALTEKKHTLSSQIIQKTEDMDTMAAD